MFKAAKGWGAGLLLAIGALFTAETGAHGGAGEPIVDQRFSKALADIPGKEALLLTVEYPPGGADPVHRHDAHGIIYVLEGEILMGVKGGQTVTLRPGDTFYEGPDDIHTIGRNASDSRPAKFLVLLLKNSGKDAFIPVH